MMLRRCVGEVCEAWAAIKVRDGVPALMSTSLS